MKKIFFLAFSLLFITKFYAQPQQQRGYLRIMFYNCENFFDIEDDPTHWDEQFTPNGEKHWTYWKYRTKVIHIAKVITAVGGWEPPDLVGLCEIENQKVLEDLTKNSPLKVFKYHIVHYESPDRRGIDVALLYRDKKFILDTSYKIPVIFPKKLGGKPTRDILFVRGRVKATGDSLYVMVNHWPSRFGGHMATDPLRMFVAVLVRRTVDSIFRINPRAYIVVIGDLNDYPTDKSLLEGLKVRTTFDTIVPDDVYNLSYYLQEVKGEFSHKHQGEGGILDQIIVSGTLLDKKGDLYTSKDDAHVYKSDFLLEKDPNYPGYRPFRTYIGFKYIGGYSDHLPVYLDIYLKK